MGLKNIIAGISAAAMTFALTGCGEKKSSNKEIKEFDGFYAARIAPISDDNEIQKIIADKTGVLVHQNFVDDQDSINKIISDMIAANKYPDYISPDAESCQKLLKAGAFIPIDNYWDDYPNIKKLCTDKEWDRVRSSDGHIYYIPLFSSVNVKETTPTHSGEAFWVQTKVLEWANYPKLKTPDDYFDLIERYLAENPVNEKGEPYYGYEIQANDTWFFALDNPPMFLDGHPNDGCCIVDPDTLTAIDYNLSPTAKKWFRKLNEEYKKGVIDQECFVMTSDQYYKKIATGRVLGMVDQNWNFSGSTNELPPECTYIPFGLTIDEGIEEHYRDRNSFNDSTGVGISISCDDPDGAVKFLSDLLEPEILNLRFWGIEDTDYYVNEDGYFDQDEEQYAKWRDSDYRRDHVCTYDYMPYYFGMAPDGINAYNSSTQPSIFYEHLSEPVKKCLSAYGSQTYSGLLNDPPENPPWYPMWSFSNAVTEDTDYGKVMKQIDAVKHRYLPLLVMSSDYEKTWEEYTSEYAKIDSQKYFDELTAEVRRRSAD